jgi:ABC-type multidrug transport system ATPase subunit
MPNDAPLTLQIKNLALSYNSQQVLQDVSFELITGRIMALIGPNGAGKSSTMRVIAGLVRPEEGHAELNGEKLTFNALRKHFGFFIESPSFYNYLTAKENLDLLIRISGSNQKSEDLIELVGLSHAGKKKFSMFSKGMKQRLGIAQTLIGDPNFLVLDEPFNGLDPEVKAQLMDLVINLAAEKNKGVLVTSHLLADLEQMADDFVLLNKGNIHLKGRVSDYINEKQRVTMLFNQDLPKQLDLSAYTFLEQEANSLLLRATAAETESLLLALAANGVAPYSVQRSDLLHEKYMELAE